MFDAKIGTMQKLLRHSMSRFSLEKVHATLKHLLRLVIMQEYNSFAQDDIQEETGKYTPSELHITSTGQMRTILDKLLKDNTSRTLPADHIKIVKFLKHFLADVSSFKKVKDHFDMGVFKYLKSMHHALDHHASEKSKHKKQKRFDNFDERDSGNFSQTELDEQLMTPRSAKGNSASNDQLLHNQLGFSTASEMDGNMKQKLDITIKELEDTSERWSRLLQSGDLDMNDFDLESHHEIVHLTDYSHFESMLRLFPDMFAKLYKCIELSKQWWGLLHKVYKDFPRSGKRLETSKNSTKTTTDYHDSNTKSTNVIASHVAVESTDKHFDNVDVDARKIPITDTPRDVTADSSRSNTMSSSISSIKYTDINKGNDSLLLEKQTSNDSIKKEYPVSRQRDEAFTPSKCLPKSRSASFPLILLKKSIAKHRLLKTDDLQLNSNEITRDTGTGNTKKPKQIKVFTSDTFTKLPEKNTRELNSKLKNINRLIMECHVQMQQYSNEQAEMQSRENRLLTMSGIWGKLGQNLSEEIQRYTRIKHQLKELAQKFSYTIRGTSKYFDLREKVRRCEVKLHQYDKAIRLLRYQQAVVGQDYMLEMDLRPDFIRVADNLQQCMNELTHRLTELRFEKYTIERELKLLNESTFPPTSVAHYGSIKEDTSDVFTPDFKSYNTPRSYFDHNLPKSGYSTPQGSIMSSVPPMATDIRDILGTGSSKRSDTLNGEISPVKPIRRGLLTSSKALHDPIKRPEDSTLSRAKESKNTIALNKIPSTPKKVIRAKEKEYSTGGLPPVKREGIRYSSVSGVTKRDSHRQADDTALIRAKANKNRTTTDRLPSTIKTKRQTGSPWPL